MSISKKLIVGSLILLGTSAILYFAPQKAGMALGASVFNSQQLAPSASNGYILSTDGTNNSWIVNTGGSFPFTPFTSYNGTSTPIGFSAGLFTNGSTTITSVGSGFVQAVNGLLSPAALTSGQITTALGFTPANQATTITLNGTANQITSSAGAQDLSANRTWTFSLPSHVIFPGNFQATNATTTNATTTSLAVIGSTTVGSIFQGGGLTTCTGTSALTYSGTAFTCTAQPQGTVTNVTATAPLFSSGGATPNLTWFGLSTTSALTQGQILYNTTAGNGVASVASTTVTAGNGLTGSITVLNSGGASNSLGLATINAGVLGATLNGVVPTSQATSTLYGASTGGMVLGWDNASGGIKWVATSTVAGGSASTTLLSDLNTWTKQQNFLSFGTTYATSTFASSTALTATRLFSTDATTTSLAITNTTLSSLLYSAVGGSVLSVATGTVSAGSSAITVTAGRAAIGGALAIDCAVASASQAGCLSTTDWTTFNNKTVWPFTINAASVFYGQASQSTTTEMHFGATGYSLTASTTAAFNIINTGSSTATVFANAPLVVAGNNVNYTQAVIQNTNAGANASSLLAVHNDLATDSTYYGEFGMNSSGYNQSAFASQWPNSVFLNASDGQLLIGTASTTNLNAGVVIFTGGTATSSIRMTYKQNGFIAIGTSTPSLGALTIASTTGFQEMWSAGAGFSQWGVRNSFGTLYFSTTSITSTATSTLPAFSINATSGAVFIRNLGNAVMSVVNGVVSQLTLGLGLLLSSNTLYTIVPQSFTYATSTAWTATTTIPLEVGQGEQWNYIRCFTDVGTLNVDFYQGDFTKGNKHLLPFFNASTTIGTTTPTSNNVINIGTTTAVRIGTPASSPTKITCTIWKQY